MSRRRFLGYLAAGFSLSQLPVWVSCQRTESQERSSKLLPSELLLIQYVQEFLFPNDGLGPGARDINAHGYLQWILTDDNYDADERAYIRRGMGWTDETALETAGNSFISLDSGGRQKVLLAIYAEDWGVFWFSLLLNLILEALLADPIYGCNLEQTGWKWLNHNPGEPRPAEALKYGVYLNKNLKPTNFD